MSSPTSGQTRRILRFLGVGLALALAYAAQYLFDHSGVDLTWLPRLPLGQPPWLSAGVVLLLAGAVLFVLAAPAVRWSSGRVIAAPQADGSRPAATALLLLAAAAWIACLLLYLLRGESALVRWLWAGSLVVLVLSQVPWGALRTWVLPRRDWARYGLPLFLLLVAAALRLYRLPSLPQDLHGDMASHGLQAQAILAGQVPGLVGAGWAAIPLPGFLPTAAAMLLAGDQGMLGLRLASAVGGVLSVWGLFVLLDLVSTRRVALIAAALLAVSYTHIHFSRIAEYMDPVPLTVWSLVFLVWGLRSGRALPFVLSGVLLALAGMMYYSGRVALVVVGLLLLYLLLFQRQPLWSGRRGLLYLGLGWLVATGPLLVYFLQHGQTWLGRSQEVFLLNPAVVEHLQHKYGVQGLGPVLLEQARRSLLMFNVYGDSSTQFGLARPMVDSLTAPLVVLGLAYAIAHPRQPALALLAIWLGTVLVIGSILTNNAPFWPRLVAILLPALALVAVTVDRTWTAITGAFGPESARIAAMLVVGGLIYVGITNWLIYYPIAAHNGRPRAIVGRFVGTLPADTTVCLLPDREDEPDGWIHSLEEREIAFFMPGMFGIDLPPGDPAGALQSNPQCGQAGAVWIVPAGRQPALDELAALAPGGPVDAHYARPGELIFYSYEVR